MQEMMSLWYRSCDIGDIKGHPAMKQAYEMGKSGFGCIDVLVNNAGYGLLGFLRKFLKTLILLSHTSFPYYQIVMITRRIEKLLRVGFNTFLYIICL